MTAYDLPILIYGTTYNWKIVAWDTHGASTSSLLWNFMTNSLPYQPDSPSPPIHATGVDINADLSWTGGDPDPGDTILYDVYFGVASSPPKVASNQSGTTYDSGTMNYPHHLSLEDRFLGYSRCIDIWPDMGFHDNVCS